MAKYLIFFFCVSFLNFNCFFGLFFAQKTPKKYRWYNPVSGAQYSRDSLLISKMLLSYIRKEETMAYYFDSKVVDTSKTMLHIDTIIFNLGSNKASVLFAMESLHLEHSKYIKGKPVELGPTILYDGYGFIGKKIDGEWKYAFYSHRVDFYESKKECEFRIRQILFTEMMNDNSNEFKQYNVDDRRIWSSPEWDTF